MNTFQLQCFVAVANTLNFARAAEQMNISQPAITHQIKTLESELNTKLFYRSTRLVELTPEGTVFLPDAQSMISIAELAKARFSNPKDKPIEKLSIACSSYYQLALLSESINALAQFYPNLHPLLTVVPHEQLNALIDNGSTDVIFDIYDETKSGHRLTYTELVQSPIVCTCRKDHPLLDLETVSIQELRQFPLIFCNPIKLVPDVTRLQMKLAEGRHPVEMHYCDSPEAAVVLVSAGLGVAALPKFLIPNEGHIAQVPLTDAPTLSYGAFYKPYPGDDVRRKFIQLIKQQTMW